MRKLLFAVPLTALTLFAAGYLIGQVRSVTSGFAASSGPVVVNPGSYGSTNLAQPAASTPGAVNAKHADGTVAAINGNTITVKPDNDAAHPDEYTSVTTIVVNGSTQYNVTGGKSGITVGARIFAVGSVSSDGKTLSAAQVSAGRAGSCPHGPQSSGTAPSTGSGPNI